MVGWGPEFPTSSSLRASTANGAQETVTYELVNCPNLRDIRRELRSEAGDAFSSVSSLLGGSIEGRRGKPDTVSRARTVKAVLDFAEAP